ncbi:MAG: hypothetical protein SXU28_10935, partial [Pseudomonadota bacterium]|nr:hypothetical protein [Pseudomonadota bacterium]
MVYLTPTMLPGSALPARSGSKNLVCTITRREPTHQLSDDLDRMNGRYYLHDVYSSASWSSILCNMPSALCFYDKTSMEYSNNGCIHTSNSSDANSAIQFISTQWYNGNESLSIDLTFKIMDHLNSTTHPANLTRSVGVKIRACNSSYYVTMLHDYNFTGLIGGFHSNNTNINRKLFSIPWNLTHMVDSEIYYRLQIKVTRVNETNLSFNVSNPFNGKLISITHATDEINILEHGNSGFITLYTHHANVEFKSLYVSGTMVKGDQTQNCSIKTLYPSLSPTSSTTNNPSISPSELTTSNPTPYPTSLSLSTTDTFLQTATPSLSNTKIMVVSTSLPTYFPTAMPSLSNTETKMNSTSLPTIQFDDAIIIYTVDV